MLLDGILFYFFALLIVFSAIMTVTRRNVVHCGVWLINTLVGVAGLYLLLGAEFLAAVQVILYIGGIVVLYLFVIMLVPVSEEIRQRRFAGQKWFALLAAFLLMIQLGYVISQGAESFRLAEPREPAPLGVVTSNTEQIGDVLFSEYMLPFELASILLLVAIIGAVVMAKPKAES